MTEPSEDASSQLIVRDAAPLVPAKKQLQLLSPTERMGFALAHRMNLGAWKRAMTFCQRHIGSLWIYIATYNLMNVFGIENVEDSDPTRPLVLVANHRSFFDMYTVSSVIFRRTRRRLSLFFPVRAKFFYDNPLGWFVNFVMGWFSMYPPFFREQKDARKRGFDKYSLERLIQLCSEPGANVIGFHPEGKRNLEGGTYEFLPAQPGIGKVLYATHPQVIPVFIAGLGNDLPKQIMGNWTGGDKVRIWFGEQLDLSEFYEKGDRLRTHKEIADHLLIKIGELGEQDRERMA
jgi:1-acyl-sn-glycerol-3-phosphate acyltransferase